MLVASELEHLMLDLINSERVSRGLTPLQLEQHLNASAENHSKWVLQENTFSHTGAGGSTSYERMVDAGFKFAGNWRSGENIGLQSERGAAGLADDVQDIHDRLMASSGHRANILHPEYEYVGIGIERGNYYSYDAVMITVNFAETDGAVVLDTGGSGSGGDGGAGAITGDSAANVLVGTGAADLIQGLGGNDVLRGFGGADTLEGGAGKDRMLGGAGADALNGGSGFDVAIYKDAKAGVRVDLVSPSLNTGDAAGDSFTSVEGLKGSNYSDDLRGANDSNRLFGLKGNDVLLGRGGDDWLVGGAGNDTLTGQGGTDRLIGNQGADVFVFEPGMGKDVVKDFEDDLDTLDFSAFGLKTVSDLSALAQQRGANLFLDFGDGDVAVIRDATFAQVQDDILI